MLDRRYLEPYIGSLMEEIFSPRKLPRYRYSTKDGRVYGQVEQIFDGKSLGPAEGTRDKPAIISRWVEKKYKAWHEEDGSYHEELVDDSDIPRGAEITNGD
tara:strand:- start:6711 stop:7013 length:303 start_codon:yes stop_codon:yes gene_type:complete